MINRQDAYQVLCRVRAWLGQACDGIQRDRLGWTKKKPLHLIESELLCAFQRLLGFDSGGARFDIEFAAGVDQTAYTRLRGSLVTAIAEP